MPPPLIVIKTTFVLKKIFFASVWHFGNTSIVMTPNLKASLSPETRSWFGWLSPETQAALTAAASRLEINTGKRLYEHKTEPTGLYIIRAGQVRITFQSSSGNHHLLKIASPGGIVGDLACFDGLPYPVFTEAMCPCSIDFIPLKSFRELRRSHADIDRVLLQHFARISRTLVTMMEVTFLGSLSARVASRLLFLTHEYGTRSLTISQTDIGLMAGVSRQATNKALGELTSLGLIEKRYNVIEILDYEGLLAFKNEQS
jgi:CRP-like cAMP-binding protein